MSTPRTPKRKGNRSPGSRSPSKPTNRSTPKSSSVSKSPAKEKASDLIEINVHNVMESVPESRVTVSKGISVSDLKTIISDVTDVLPEKMLLIYKHTELKSDSAPISQYGITDDCEIVMNVRMCTGSKISRSNAVLYVPPTFPEGSVTELRSKIKSMTNIRGNTKIRIPRKPRTPVDKKHSEWTAEKQMEHEITRNKMKSLLKRKRKKILSDTPPVSQGSINSRSATGLNSPDDSTKERSESLTTSASDITGITDSAMKTFFEPPETLIEMERRRKELLLPPSNMEELKALKLKREALFKTVCKMCHARLKATEQQMPCACSYVFCKLHRRPDAHYCNIDHRQAGRKKINKENPKLVFGGVRKARMTPHS